MFYFHFAKFILEWGLRNEGREDKVPGHRKPISRKARGRGGAKKGYGGQKNGVGGGKEMRSNSKERCYYGITGTCVELVTHTTHPHSNSVGTYRNGVNSPLFDTSI